jgi:hypothetical protein
MGFTVKAEGANSFEFSKDVVESADFKINIPADSDARSKDMGATVVITGKILTGLEGAVADQSIKAAQWSLVPAESANAYQKLTITVISAGQVVREYIFPQAFCVDYREEYDDQTGVGTFSLMFRQKKDKLSELQLNGGYAA